MNNGTSPSRPPPTTTPTSRPLSTSLDTLTVIRTTSTTADTDTVTDIDVLVTVTTRLSSTTATAVFTTTADQGGVVTLTSVYSSVVDIVDQTTIYNPGPGAQGTTSLGDPSLPSTSSSPGGGAAVTLPTPAIIGIAVGAFFGLVVLISVLFWWRRYARHKAQRPESPPPLPPPDMMRQPRLPVLPPPESKPSLMVATRIGSPRTSELTASPPPPPPPPRYRRSIPSPTELPVRDGVQTQAYDVSPQRGSPYPDVSELYGMQTPEPPSELSAYAQTAFMRDDGTTMELPDQRRDDGRRWY